MKKLKSLFSRFYLVLVLAFFYLPILYVIVFSFNDSKSLSKFTGFSLQWYEKMFANRTIMESIYYTVVIAVIATVVSTARSRPSVCRNPSGSSRNSRCRSTICR